jgi:hypothetical protein
MDKCCVFFDVETESINTIYMSFSFKGLSSGTIGREFYKILCYSKTQKVEAIWEVFHGLSNGKEMRNITPFFQPYNLYFKNSLQST